MFYSAIKTKILMKPVPKLRTKRAADHYTLTQMPVWISAFANALGLGSNFSWKAWLSSLKRNDFTL